MNRTEQTMKKKLDECVQTAQYYSVVVNDPSEDADNLYEWFNFFSRFGTVKYVTILKKNKNALNLIHEKHIVAFKKRKYCITKLKV
jgi:hypothetical protein